MFRLNGNIIEQLNSEYSNISFNSKYKNEIRNRTIDFFNLKIEEKKNQLTWNEFKHFLKDNIIFDMEIEKISFSFFDENKEELLNLFNPIWTTKKKEISKSKEEHILNIKIMNLFLENFPNIFIKKFYNDFYNVSKLQKRFIFCDNFNRIIPKLRKTKEIKEALKFNKKIDFDKSPYLNKLEEFKKHIINSLYLSKIEEEIVIKKELSEYIISSGLLYMNKIEFNIDVNYILDFENKEVIFENRKIKLDTRNKSYKLFKNVFDKINFIKEEINHL